METLVFQMLILLLLFFFFYSNCQILRWTVDVGNLKGRSLEEVVPATARDLPQYSLNRSQAIRVLLVPLKFVLESKIAAQQANKLGEELLGKGIMT